MRPEGSRRLVPRSRRARRRTSSGPSTDGNQRRPDLVLGLVTPVGLKVELLIKGLKEALSLVGYQAHPLRLSDFLDDAAQKTGISIDQYNSRRDRLMSIGTELRSRSQDGSLGAMLAIRAMMILRQGEEDSATPRAFILRSLKHDEEVSLLREVYGSRFVLVAATTSHKARVENLRRSLKHDEHLSDAYADAEAIRLINRDEEEMEERLGQQVRRVFPQADVFLRVPEDGSNVRATLERAVRLLFGHPYETPTRDELAMFHAYTASLRSSALGRQVGCAIIDKFGEPIVTGANEVPKAFGGQYWSGDDPDGRDFIWGREPSRQYNLALIHEVIRCLQQAGWLKNGFEDEPVEELVQTSVGEGGPLSTARVLDLLEFGRVAHAEMAALLTAARRGVSISGGSLYTTTFPCHECARLIVAGGITRVVYRDPYPKSRVGDLYSDSIDIDEDGRADKIPFEPFIGVAPRLFQRVFEAEQRKTRTTGALVDWDGREAHPRLEKADEAADEFIAVREDEVDEALQGLLDTLQQP